MHTVISFEYYSTFAPVGCTLLADEPMNSPAFTYKNTKPLQSIDRGYCIYSARKPHLVSAVRRTK